ASGTADRFRSTPLRSQPQRIGRRIAADRSRAPRGSVSMRVSAASILLVEFLSAGAFAQGIARTSLDASGGDADGASTSRSITSDGRYVAFASDATDLVAGDGDGTTDVFLRDLVNGTTTLVSVDMTGADSDGDSTAPWLDSDGDVVAFASVATDLVA